jgi:hypothetical protein
MNNEVLLYTDENGNVSLDVSLENETVWLSQKQMVELFGRDKSVISRHIKNIFKDQELDENSTVAKNATVQMEGNREVVREVEYYNLDMIISLGYRVNSKSATQFRIWATKILKEYLVKGYAINQKTVQKSQLNELTETINLIKNSIENKELIRKGEATYLFGNEKANEFKGIIRNIYHAFSDGNKRIGSFIFYTLSKQKRPPLQSKRRAENKR